MDKCDYDYVKKIFEGKRVVILGSAPSVKLNKGKNIDKYDVIVRINNYDLEKYKDFIGTRTDVHYAFYGNSIRKKKEELLKEGVYLCMCKCPNAKVLDHDKMVDFDPQNFGGDFRYIYKIREKFWFCKTYVPRKEILMEQMERLSGHMPTTGFAAVLTILDFHPKELYVTGFDGFTSKLHNIDQAWRDKSNRIDPVAHDPMREMRLFKKLARQYDFIKMDKELETMVLDKCRNHQDVIAQYEEIYLKESDKGKLYGTSSESLLFKIYHWILQANPRSILDYGAGRSGLVNYFWRDGERVVAKYDPAIREIRTKPSSPFDLVLCTDVLEHIPQDFLPTLLKDIKASSTKVFFTISLVAARRRLPNGLNAHLTVQSAQWWKELLNKHFTTVEVVFENGKEIYVKTW